MKSGKTKVIARTNKNRQFAVRYVLAGIVIIAGVVLSPLLTVWKQAYIVGASLNQKELADSCAIITQRVAELRMTVQQLSTNERIERLAGEWLQLQYPPSDKIVLVYPDRQSGRHVFADLVENWKFFAVLKRSIAQGRS